MRGSSAPGPGASGRRAASGANTVSLREKEQSIARAVCQSMHDGGVRCVKEEEKLHTIA